MPDEATVAEFVASELDAAEGVTFTDWSEDGEITLHVFGRVYRARFRDVTAE